MDRIDRSFEPHSELKGYGGQFGHMSQIARFCWNPPAAMTRGSEAGKSSTVRRLPEDATIATSRYIACAIARHVGSDGCVVQNVGGRCDGLPKLMLATWLPRLRASLKADVSAVLLNPRITWPVPVDVSQNA